MIPKSVFNLFRYGFAEVTDKQTGITYVATGDLKHKVRQLKTNIFMTLVYAPLPMIIFIPNSFPYKLPLIVLMYVVNPIMLLVTGRLMITSKDMKDVRVKGEQ
ncbi:MAG: hypothetical protein A2Y20_09060 [Firmicutes bacterium GWF2_51_9]|nr:MAG: hypothetical protein A2Y20_09060 [Firmicutes bacterium GWF2_51_9]OGS57396.1 MAG: hypothetical protein A2Y19_02715 [Firmicutes bacterium GWE2_51_13]HAM63137.1 hypothetical protein [Erysipelotrichaceae bacterium]HBZ41515.1 hypothetical protein [Erysipelotrichaceae bacterium]